MRIQGFLFARHFERRPDNNYDAQDLSLITPFLDGPPQQFPARVSRQGLVSLWRENTSGSAPARLRFQLVDPTGQPTTYPCPAPFEAEFQDGQWSCHLLVRLDFAFPAPGRYRLDIIPEGDTPDDVFHCWIDTTVDSGDTPTIVGNNPTTAVEVVTSSDDPASEWFRNPLVDRYSWSWKITA